MNTKIPIKLTKILLGFAIEEACEDYCQILGITLGEGLPRDGILQWESEATIPFAVFASRSLARAAINRTHYYAMAFDLVENLPKRKFCTIKPVYRSEP